MLEFNAYYPDVLALLSTRLASITIANTNANNPSHWAILSQLASLSASGASEPPVVTDAAIINAIITPIKLSPTINPAANNVPLRSASFKLRSRCAAALFLVIRFLIHHANTEPIKIGILMVGGK